MLKSDSFKPIIAAYGYLQRRNLDMAQFNSISEIFDDMLINNWAREPLLYWMFQNEYRKSETAIRSLWKNFDPSTNLDVEEGASLMACCHMLGIANCAEIAKRLFTERIFNPLANRSNLRFLARTLRYIGTKDCLPLLVRGYYIDPKWIRPAIQSIGYRNYDGGTSLALGGGGDMTFYLATFITLELFDVIEYRQDLVPFFLQEANSIIDLLDHRELHIRILALSALTSIIDNMLMRKLLYDKITAKLNSWKHRDLEPSEDFVLRIFAMCKKPE